MTPLKMVSGAHSLFMIVLSTLYGWEHGGPIVGMLIVTITFGLAFGISVEQRQANRRDA